MRKKIIGCIFVIFFISCINIHQVRANYHQESNLDYIDGVKESYYESVYSSSIVYPFVFNSTYYGYTDIPLLNIYFSNTENTFDIYVYYKDPIQEISYDTIVIEGKDTENIYTKSVFRNETKEIGSFYNTTSNSTQKVYRTFYINEVAISTSNINTHDYKFIIRVNNLIPVEIDVTYRFDKSPAQYEQEFADQMRETAWIIVLILAFAVLLIIRLWLLYQKPNLYAREPQEYNLRYLGRLVDSKYDDIIHKYKFFLKRNDGIHEVYSDLSYNDLRNFSLDVKNFIMATITAFHELLPHVLIKKVDVPRDAIIYNKKQIEGHRFKKFMYKFLCFLPMKSIVYSLYNSIYIETKEIINSIDYLELEYSQECMEFLFNVEYDENIVNKETGIVESKHRIDNDVLYSKVLTLSKSEVSNLEVSFSKTEIKQYKGLKDALMDRDTKDQLKSKFIRKELYLSSQIKKLSDENYDYFEKLRQAKDSQSSLLIESLEKFVAKSDSIDSNIPEIIGKIFQQKRLGANEKQQYVEALKELSDLKTIQKSDGVDTERFNTTIEQIKKALETLAKGVKYQQVLGEVNNDKEPTTT